jgi:uncharacterized protein (DUF1800 family)
VHIYKTALSANEIEAVAYEIRPCPAAPSLTLDIDASGLEQQVQDAGFLVSGSIDSGHIIERLEVRLIDPQSGRLLDHYTADITPQGKWAVWVGGTSLSAGQPMQVDIVALDAGGNSTTRSFNIDIVPFDFHSPHLVNRITYGATPALLKEVDLLGAANFLAQQLAPQTIDDQAFETLIAGFEPTTKSELQIYVLLHTIYSRRQLQEVMTWFWDNHFNTDVNKHNSVAYELAENRAFRANALGRFRDLLEISAKSPAMLVYLDGITNVTWAPNENYAREVLELHTLGVDGGYTQTDVEEVAKVFTGWHVSNGAFFFNATKHNTEDKVALGQVIPGGGMEEGEAVLDLLADHPSTARFICTKLSVLLVTDTPPATLVQRCADKFLATAAASDQIAQVVRLLLTSSEFMQAVNYRSKVKNPLEFAVGLVRNLQAQGNSNDLPPALRQMGLDLFKYPIPAGYAETGAYWVNAHLMLERIKFVHEIADNTPASNRTSLDPVAFFKGHGYATAEGIVSFLFKLVFGDDYTDLERTLALGVLTDDGARVFDINAPDADRRLRRLLGTVLSYPGYLYQ